MEGDLSLNRFAHRMHSRFLEQRTISQGSIYAGCRLVETGGVALPTPTRLRIFHFPVNTFRVLSPSFPPLVSWLFHFSLSFFLFFFLHNSSFFEIFREERGITLRAMFWNVINYVELRALRIFLFLLALSYLYLKRLPINREFLFIFDRNENVFLRIYLRVNLPFWVKKNLKNP